MAMKAYKWHGQVSDPRCTHEQGYADCLCAAKDALDLCRVLNKPLTFLATAKEVPPACRQFGLATGTPYTVFFRNLDDPGGEWRAVEEKPPAEPPPAQYAARERVVEGQCARKKAYATVAEANRAVRGCVLSGRVSSLSVYQCPHCGSYHLTKVARVSSREARLARRL